MRHLLQFLQAKSEEILVTGVAVPLLLTAVLSGNPVFIAHARTPEGVRYRLAYIPYGTQEPMVLYDNHHRKGHHRHIQGVESPYPFTSGDRLLEDFQADVAHLQEGHEGWRRP